MISVESLCLSSVIRALQRLSAHRRLCGYGRLGADIRRCGCWAHVRRKFHEGIQAVPQEEQPTCASQKGLEYCDRLFALERDYAKLMPEEQWLVTTTNPVTLLPMLDSTTLQTNNTMDLLIGVGTVVLTLTKVPHLRRL